MVNDCTVQGILFFKSNSVMKLILFFKMTHMTDFLKFSNFQRKQKQQKSIIKAGAICVRTQAKLKLLFNNYLDYIVSELNSGTRSV